MLTGTVMALARGEVESIEELDQATAEIGRPGGEQETSLIGVTLVRKKSCVQKNLGWLGSVSASWKNFLETHTVKTMVSFFMQK